VAWQLVGDRSTSRFDNVASPGDVGRFGVCNLEHTDRRPEETPSRRVLIASTLKPHESIAITTLARRLLCLSVAATTPYQPGGQHDDDR
jgi:hypothetical protein